MQRKEAKIEDAWYRVMAELDREQWATPAKLVAYMEQRVGP